MRVASIMFLLLCWVVSAYGKTPDYQQALKAIASVIEALKGEYPQLSNFSAADYTDKMTLVIDYSFHTHQAAHTGGWTSGVPNPDDDGIWFYIDFHGPKSVRQIHCQPKVSTRARIGNMEAFMLILEGIKTKPVEGLIWALVKQQADQFVETFEFTYDSGAIKVILDATGHLNFHWITPLYAHTDEKIALQSADEHQSKILLTASELDRFKRLFRDNGILALKSAKDNTKPTTQVSKSSLSVILGEQKNAFSWIDSRAVPEAVIKTVDQLVAIAQEIRKSRMGANCINCPGGYICRPC